MNKEYKSILVRQTSNTRIYLGNSRLDKKGNVIFLKEEKEELVIKMYRKILEGKTEGWLLTEEGWQEKLKFLNETHKYYK